MPLKSARAASCANTLFSGKARCATCHVPPLFTEPGWNLQRPLKLALTISRPGAVLARKLTERLHCGGFFAHAKGGFYHDGRFATLNDVVEHYNQLKNLGLSAEEQRALVEYFKVFVALIGESWQAKANRAFACEPPIGIPCMRQGVIIQALFGRAQII